VCWTIARTLAACRRDVESDEKLSRFLCPLALGNIDDATDKAEKFACLTEARRCSVNGPTVFAIVPTQAVFQLKNYAFGMGRNKRMSDGFEVVCVHCLKPTEDKPAVGRLSGAVVPGLAEE
jgi:hypothetical protein